MCVRVCSIFIYTFIITSAKGLYNAIDVNVFVPGDAKARADESAQRETAHPPVKAIWKKYKAVSARK